MSVFPPQIRFVMKSYSFIRESTAAVLRNTPQKGNADKHSWFWQKTELYWEYIWIKCWIQGRFLMFSHRWTSTISVPLQLSVLLVLPDSDLSGGLSSVNTSCYDKRLYYRHTNQYPHCLFSFRNPFIRWNYVGMNFLKVRLTNCSRNHISGSHFTQILK